MKFNLILKHFISLALLVVYMLAAQAQNMDELDIGKLRHDLEASGSDSSRALIMTKLAEAYRGTILDSTFYFGEGALELSRRISYGTGEAKALCVLCFYHYTKGDLPTGMKVGLDALAVARQYGLLSEQACAMIRISNIYMVLGNYSEALGYLHDARELTKNMDYRFYHTVTYWRTADAFMSLKMTDSAFHYGKIAEQEANKTGNHFIVVGVAPTLGTAYAEKGDDTMALRYFMLNRTAVGSLALAQYHMKRGRTDSAIFYGLRSRELASAKKERQTEMFASVLLSDLYEETDPRMALHFKNIALAAKDSLYGAEKITAAATVAFKEKEQESKVLLAQTTYRSKVKIYLALAGLLFVLAAALLLYRNNRNERKANAMLKAQRNEIARALTELKSAQAQLVQSEKMASLGELTAGIAHEIQNPLNFVNNFSEVNVELSGELEMAARKGDLDEVRALAGDIRSNQERIKEHGQRADAIVKSMLQHSRASSGQKEPTDLAVLAEEYLKLSYHGMRAKDKDFNVTMETDFEPGLPTVNVVPQDIGRVLLNLYNNAFHAVMERKKSGEAGYEPKIRVEVRGVGGHHAALSSQMDSQQSSRQSAAVNSEFAVRNPEWVRIAVSDNGPGIPEAIRTKIFQPFFTTKPTGQGTGLGLSLSYDIVTKGHGGDLKLESQAGAGASFSVVLPV